MWERFGQPGYCWRCGRRVVDKVKDPDKEVSRVVRHHLLPRSEGGDRIPDNLALLCSNCHSAVNKKMKELTVPKRGIIEILVPERKPHPIESCIGRHPGAVKVKKVWEFEKSIAISIFCSECNKEYAWQFI